jgi:hypothetical protein
MRLFISVSGDLELKESKENENRGEVVLNLGGLIISPMISYGRCAHSCFRMF